MNTGIEIGIVDSKEIIKVIHNLFGYDFSNYSLTSFKRRIALSIESNHLKSPEQLISKLKNEEGFFEIFLKNIRIGSTEMFRDPSLWIFLYNEILSKILSNNPKPKIWLPDCVSGDELFSLMIILKETNLIDKFEVIANTYSNKNFETIKSGFFEAKKLQISNDNYKLLNCPSKLSDYYQIKNNIIYRDVSLIKNVNFKKQNSIFDVAPEEVDLILYRNQLVYFNQTLHDKTLGVLHKANRNNGFLIIGVKEIVPLYFKGYTLFNNSESVYKKKNLK